MRSTFMSFDIARKAIMAQQSALDITGHNIANASTPGYTRQVPNLKTTTPFAAPQMNSISVGQFGTGVTLAEIQRLRDQFTDLQIRDENKKLGYWDTLQTTLSTIEVILNEPSDEGLRGVLDEFWTAWQSLAESPESEAVRAVVLERGQEVVDAFQHCYKQLFELREDVNASIKAKVEEINSIASQIASLNYQIQSIVVAGMSPNDLYDSRDLLLDQLSKLIDVQVTNDRNGMITVQIGGVPLVQGNRNRAMGLNTDADGMYKVVWDPDPDSHPGTAVTGKTASPADFEISATSGELVGLLDLRGPADNSTLGSARQIIPNLINMLNTLAKTVIMNTNAVHRGGYSLNNANGAYPDGINFFTQDVANENDPSIQWAKIISIDSRILADVKNIAAASHQTLNSTGTRINFGDGSNALKIAQLKQTLSRSEYWTQSDALSETFPSSMAGTFTVTYNSTAYTITMPAPATLYQDMREVVDAINAQLQSAGLTNVYARAEGKRLVFYSSSDLFGGVTAGTFPASGFSALAQRTLVEEATVDDFWRAHISSIGVISQEAARMVSNQKTLVSELEAKRQSTSGVSLDEEMTNMIQYQHAYNAAARYMTAIDEAIDVIINRMGVVGR